MPLDAKPAATVYDFPLAGRDVVVTR